MSCTSPRSFLCVFHLQGAVYPIVVSRASTDEDTFLQDNWQSTVESPASSLARISHCPLHSAPFPIRQSRCTSSARRNCKVSGSTKIRGWRSSMPWTFRCLTLFWGFVCCWSLKKWSFKVTWAFWTPKSKNLWRLGWSHGFVIYISWCW